MILRMRRMRMRMRMIGDRGVVVDVGPEVVEWREVRAPEVVGTSRVGEIVAAERSDAEMGGVFDDGNGATVQV